MVRVTHSYTSGLMGWIGLVVLALSLGMPVARANPAAAGAVAGHPNLASMAALVMDNESGQVLYGKNADSVLPIASITKVMTAMVVLDANLDPEERLTVSSEDVDTLRNSHSRLPVGVTLTRDEMLRLALMASENRAAFALSRYYPGGREAFVHSMNLKAVLLGMRGTRYADPTGLSSSNVSTAEDLGRLVRAAHEYDKIREYSTLTNFTLNVGNRPQQFRNTNGLVMSPDWEIGLSKTGFINEAGRCLVMQARLAGRAVVIVLLDSVGRYTRTADATRIRRWLEVAAGYVNETKVAVRSATRSRVTRSAQARTAAPAPAVRTRATTRVQAGARTPST